MARQSRISHISDTELANYSAKQIGDMFYNGNTGAGYNAIVARGVKPASERNTTATAKPVAIRQLPGRIEDYLLDNILPDDWNDDREIPRHFVELVVISDTPDWNKRVRRLGPDELSMLESFLGDKATMNRRENEKLAELASAPFKASLARIAAVAAIDAQLDGANCRFESMRYDAAIVAAYA